MFLAVSNILAHLSNKYELSFVPVMLEIRWRATAVSLRSEQESGV